MSDISDLSAEVEAVQAAFAPGDYVWEAPAGRAVTFDRDEIAHYAVAALADQLRAGKESVNRRDLKLVLRAAMSGRYDDENQAACERLAALFGGEAALWSEAEDE